MHKIRVTPRSETMVQVTPARLKSLFELDDMYPDRLWFGKTVVLHPAEVEGLKRDGWEVV